MYLYLLNILPTSSAGDCPQIPCLDHFRLGIFCLTPSSCRSSFVGDPALGARGISGGQRRRLSVARTIACGAACCKEWLNSASITDSQASVIESIRMPEPVALGIRCSETKARIMFCDEPTSGLSATDAEQLMRASARVCRPCQHPEKLDHHIFSTNRNHTLCQEPDSKTERSLRLHAIAVPQIFCTMVAL